MGSMNKEQAFKLLDAFFDMGGNFIDTANNYQGEESETWIGEWMKKRGNRDEIVLASKYTTLYKAKGGQNKVNYAGNHKKSLHVSLRDSLSKLQTDYIDILYVHWWDWTTSVEEMMDALDDVVKSGKVLYLGVSDAPAWVVAQANTYARAHGKNQFVIYQGKWSILNRDFEREIIPMARAFGLALAPWGALGGGKFQTKAQLEERKKAGEGLRSFESAEQTEDEVKISEALEKVANELGTKSITAVALAYVLQKVPYVFPIVGGRKVEHLKDNAEALSLRLSEEQIKYLESIKPISLGFPYDVFGTQPGQGGQECVVLNSVAQYSWVKNPKAIGAE